MNTFEVLQQKMARFVSERDWDKFHSPKNLAMSISIESAELMEIFQWMTIEESHHKAKHDESIRNDLKDEIADIIIYCLSLANKTDIDLKEVIEEKMRLNNSRFPIDETLS